MPVWLSALLVDVLTRLGSILLAKGMERVQAVEKKTLSESEIDQKLKNLKTAYSEAMNGKPVTPEEKQKLQVAISDFVRGGDSRGL